MWVFSQSYLIRGFTESMSQSQSQYLELRRACVRSHRQKLCK